MPNKHACILSTLEVVNYPVSSKEDNRCSDCCWSRDQLLKVSVSLLHLDDEVFFVLTLERLAHCSEQYFVNWITHPD